MGRSRNSLLIVSLTGGLGNQLFQVANAIRLELDTKLLLTKNFGRPRLNNLGEAEIASFNLPFSHEFTKNAEAPYLLRKVLGHTLKISEHPIRHEKSALYFLSFKIFSSIFASIYYRKITIIKTTKDKASGRSSKFFNYLSLGYFQFMPKELEVFSREVMGKIEILSKTEKLQEEMVYALARKILFVHIRLTDYLNEPDIGLLNISYYNRAIQQYLKRIQIKEIWIFSDDHVTAGKILFIPGDVKTRFISEEDFSVAESFELLRCGSYYVLSNSTFGWWAAFLSKKKDPLVIMPSPWFRNLKYDASLKIRNWEQIPAEWSQ